MNAFKTHNGELGNSCKISPPKQKRTNQTEFRNQSEIETLGSRWTTIQLTEMSDSEACYCAQTVEEMTKFKSIIPSQGHHR